MIIVGSLITSIGLGTLLGGTVTALVTAQQGENGFLNSPSTTLSVASYAITSEPIQTAGMTATADGFATLRVQAASLQADQPIFMGIARTSDVNGYLEAVRHSEVASLNSIPGSVVYRVLPGSETPAPPGEQDFWQISIAGTGTQQLIWDSGDGMTADNWTIVIMNEDASPGVDVVANAGLRSDLFAPLAAALIIGGLIGLLIGIALIVVAATSLGRRQPKDTPGSPGVEGTVPERTAPTIVAAYPALLVGHLDPTLSRWLWLFKWFLLIPHLLLLAFLWTAVWIVTVIAWFAILFTGRYPRSLFAFTVGVLRWSWRVSYYGYAALGTDRYPPFTLEKTDYPADFDVDYPEHLSRGLIFVKSWLLAIPHLLIVSAFTAAAYGGWNTYRGGWDLSLIGLLVLIAAIALLFTGRYLPGLFGLVLGINRWIFRVITYVGLLRDEYPPFRLDQGAEEPVTTEHRH
ncbi:hypothetical protein JF66_03510 [Cryobacterium sp. MLB-32]|nr:hypothetical protein JF66_03510 [Cryobacterium sp. MLB-32]